MTRFKRSIAAAILASAFVGISSQALADHTALPLFGKDVVTGDDVKVESQEPASTQAQVVVFLSAKCPCSDSHIVELKNLAKDYSDVRFVAVHSNIDESPEKTKEYFKAEALPFPVLQDDANKIADRLEANKTPHAYIIVKNEIVYRGGVSDRKNFAPDNRLYLREALEDLKHNRSIRTPEARTLGCAIPRS